jgi:hypothetical protein
MKKLIRSIFILSMALLAVTSCKKATPEEMALRIIHNGSVTNENAILIYSFDGFAMLDKANLNKISGVREYAPIVTMFTEKYRKPETFGANVAEKVHLVLVGDMKNETGYAFTAFAVTDSKKLEASIKEIHSGYDVEKDGDLNYIDIDGASIILWDGQVVVVLVSGEASMDLLSEAKKLHALKDEKPADCAELSNYLTKTSEISGFAFVDKAMEMSKFNDDIKLDAELEKILKDAYSEFHISFEPGKVVFEQNNHMAKVKGSKYNILDAGAVNANLLSYLSAEGAPLAMIGSKINIANLINLMDGTSQDGKKASDELNKAIGWDGAKIASVFTGDFAFAFNNIIMKKPEMDEFMKSYMDDPFFAELYSTPQPTPVFSTIIGISDKAAILEMLAKNNTVINEQNVADLGDIKLYLGNNMMLFSSDEEVINNAINGKGKGKVLGNASSPIFGMYDGITFSKKIPKDILAELKEQGIGKETLEMIEKIEMNFSIEGGKVELIMKDREKNAMESFATQIGKIVMAMGGGFF